ncbi:MAG: hypothetical protein IT448_05040 [Phycisphaerales bacterium]|nr:hypothetical protein [Phycisphaerales bacterium]
MAVTPPQTRDKYEVARPAGKCAVSGRDLTPDEKFMAALRETPTGFERVDVAMEHWSEFDRTNLLASWQTAMPRPQQKKRLLVDDEVLKMIFERLQETTEQTKLHFRFVLGLILMRKRMLVYENTRQEQNQEIWIVRLRGQDQHFDLVNPRMTEQQVQEVSQQMSQIINEEI